MDWTGCDLVEVDPEKVAGQPIVKGTRVPADVVLIDQEYGRTPEQTQFPDAGTSDYPRPSRLRAFSCTAVSRVKVVLDENIPHDLRAHFSHHDTYTVAYLRWAGLKNGRQNFVHRPLISAGGKGGIRTHERVPPLPVFKTGAFNRSATFPFFQDTRFIHCKTLLAC